MSRRKSSPLPFAGLNEMAFKAPVVAWLRMSAFAAAFLSPGRYDKSEPARMVSEKLAAAAEGAMDASVVAAAGIGEAMLTGRTPPDLAQRVGEAALEPARRQVRRNYRRLVAKSKRRRGD